MNNHLFTAGELLTINTNLRQLEKELGHPIPGGLVSPNDLKDHILRTGEVLTICQNIRQIEKHAGRPAPKTDFDFSNFHPIHIVYYAILIALIFIISAILG